MSKSFAEMCPDKVHLWHREKNGDLGPEDVSYGSQKKVWWRCPVSYDHEWQARVGNISNGQGCACCAGRMVCVSNCLATLRPDVTCMWHPTKNGNLTPYDVTIGSQKKVWWKCVVEDDHEWIATVKDISKGKCCPYCAGQKVCVSNCLQTLRPDIALLWHPTKNKKLTPYDVTVSSDKKVWWKCPVADDHEWLATVGHVSDGTGCACCSGRQVVMSNCLATLRPDVASMWHPTKNGKLTPYDVTPYSSKKVWWQCNKNNSHEWPAKVANVSNGTGCPTCNQPKGERWIESWLLTNNIQFTSQYKIPECKNKKPLPFDFAVFVNDNIMLVEFHGRQHFLPVDYFGGEKSLKYTQRNDKIKQSFCQQHNLPLLILDYTQSDAQMQECMEKFFWGGCTTHRQMII